MLGHFGKIKLIIPTMTKLPTLETSSSRIEISVREAEGGTISFKNGNEVLI